MTKYSFHHKGRLIHMIDTPGFNDTNRSDTDILREISYWLAESYSPNQKLAGIIYIHKIDDNRIGKSALTTLEMFRQLCGDNYLPNVVLATTMWSEHEADLPKQLLREEELKVSHLFWAPLIEKELAQHDIMALAKVQCRSSRSSENEPSQTRSLTSNARWLSKSVPWLRHQPAVH